MSSVTVLSRFMRPMIRIGKNSLRFFNKNSNLILTFVSAAGVLVTVSMAIKGTIKAVKLYEEKMPMGTKEVIKTVWKCYIPTMGMIVLTTTAILCNGKMNAKKIAMLTSAYGSTMEALKLTEAKMAEVIGPKKTQALIDDVHSQKAEDHRPKSDLDIIDTGNGNELFFIEDVGQWIYSDTNHIELAKLKTWNDLEDSNDWDENGDNFILMNDALAHLGAKPCYMGGANGWYGSDLKKLGLKGPDFRISSKRMDINGVNRAVGTIWFEPEATPI